jgi:hypothetical protein
MTTMRVHFDGRVLVPDGPVDLPVGRTLEIEVREPIEDEPPVVETRMTEHNGLPVVNVPPGTRVISTADVRHAEDEQ